MTTATILHFTPRAEVSAHQNVLDFIELSRKAEIFGANRQFDQNVWDTGLRLKGKNNAIRAIFSNTEAAKANCETPVMEEPFLSFAKALLVYMQAAAPVAAPAVRIAALRALESALRFCTQGARPTAVSSLVLDKAVEIVKEQFSHDAAYRVAGQLEAIAELMRSKGFIDLAMRWRHGVKKGEQLGSRITKEAIEAREKKMPSSAALRAIGSIYYVAEGVVDNLVVCFAALMMCAPERVNEVMRLPQNCLVEGEGEYSGSLGIRWPGSKRAPNTTKWLPSAMCALARDAIARLDIASKRAREIAFWYEKNPGQIYLHEGVQHLRGRSTLTYDEVAHIVFGENAKPEGAKQWCRLNGVKGGAAAGFPISVVSFDDVEQAVLKLLPPSFPFTSSDQELKFSDALGVIRKNELHATRGKYECLIDVIEQGDIANRLGQRDESGIPSMFKRYGFTEDDGSPIVITTHQFRHYLNHLAQMGGMSQAEIAIFSGRKEVRQNVVYDHMTSAEAQKPISTALVEHGFTKHLVTVPVRTLINRSDFIKQNVFAGHTTDYGYCEHNFASEPCQLHRDCINCPEQVCIKGEDHKEQNLRRLRVETEELLKEAKLAMAEEEYGADRWVAHQQTTLERINSLLALMENPAVPVGSRIALRGVSVPLPIGSELNQQESTFLSSNVQGDLK